MVVAQTTSDRSRPRRSGTASVVTSLGTFTVNLRGSGGGRVLRVEVQVEGKGSESETVVARTFVDECVRQLGTGELTAVDAAMAKWWTTELQNKVADRCLQLHGGYGYMDEYPVSKAWRDARVQSIYGGTNEIMKEIIGRSLGL